MSDFYLGLPCPVCGRYRIEWIEGEGVKCEKCGADTEVISSEIERLRAGLLNLR